MKRGAVGQEPGRALRPLVEGAVRQIPRGRVTTYGDIARALGDVRAARAVAETLARDTKPGQVPGHRVVMKDGSLGGFAFGGPDVKAQQLRAEGLSVKDGRVEEIERVAFRGMRVTALFSEFAAAQERLARRVSVAPATWSPRVAVGVDASYSPEGDRAWAAACAYEVESGRPLDTAVAPFSPPIPYVPGYLAFRELPGIAAAVRALPPRSRRGAVVLVDGQGILHPRRCGIASMLALEVGLPAIGVAKSKLVGKPVGRPRKMEGAQVQDLSIDGQVHGALVHPAGSRAPLVVSPGSGVSVTQAVQWVARLSRNSPKGPLAVLAADQESRRARSASS